MNLMNAFVHSDDIDISINKITDIISEINFSDGIILTPFLYTIVKHSSDINGQFKLLVKQLAMSIDNDSRAAICPLIPLEWMPLLSTVSGYLKAVIESNATTFSHLYTLALNQVSSSIVLDLQPYALLISGLEKAFINSIQRAIKFSHFIPNVVVDTLYPAFHDTARICTTFHTRFVSALEYPPILSQHTVEELVFIIKCSVLFASLEDKSTLNELRAITDQAFSNSQFYSTLTLPFNFILFANIISNIHQKSSSLLLSLIKASDSSTFIECTSNIFFMTRSDIIDSWWNSLGKYTKLLSIPLRARKEFQDSFEAFFHETKIEVQMKEEISNRDHFDPENAYFDVSLEPIFVNNIPSSVSPWLTVSLKLSHESFQKILMSPERQAKLSLIFRNLLFLNLVSKKIDALKVSLNQAFDHIPPQEHRIAMKLNLALADVTKTLYEFQSQVHIRVNRELTKRFTSIFEMENFDLASKELDSILNGALRSLYALRSDNLFTDYKEFCTMLWFFNEAIEDTLLKWGADYALIEKNVDGCLKIYNRINEHKNRLFS